MENIHSIVTKERNENLQNAIARVLNYVQADQIYYHSFELENRPYNELIILVSNNCKKALTEICPLLDMIFDSDSHLKYRLFYAHQVYASLKQGNLFLHQCCTIQNLVYVQPASVYDFKHLEQDIEPIVLNANVLFDQEMRKVQNFVDGVHFYRNKGELGQVAFMIHQSIELTYRALELLIIGKEKKTHSIQLHQQYVLKYLPSFLEVFPAGDVSEQELINQLNTAYTAVRYEKSFFITEVVIDEFLERLSALRKRVDILRLSVLDYLIKRAHCNFKEIKAVKDFVGLKEIEAPIFLTDTLERVVEAVKSVCSKFVLYLINKLNDEDLECTNNDSVHNILLLHSECTINSPVLKEKLDQIHAKATGVNLFNYSITDFLNENHENALFFTSVFRNGTVICQSEEIDFSLSLKHRKQTFYYEDILNKFYKRQKKAQIFACSSIKMMNVHLNNEALFLMYRGVEEACLAFAYLFRGFFSAKFNLKQVLNLCISCAPKLILDFFQSLKAVSISDFFEIDRLNFNQDLNEQEFCFLIKACSQFVKSLNGLCQQYLISFTPTEQGHLPLFLSLELEK